MGYAYHPRRPNPFDARLEMALGTRRQRLTIGLAAVTLFVAGYVAGALMRSHSAQAAGWRKGRAEYPFESTAHHAARKAHEAMQCEMEAAGLRPSDFDEGSGHYIVDGVLRDRLGPSDTAVFTHIRTVMEIAAGQEMMDDPRMHADTASISHTIAAMRRPWFSVRAKVALGKWYWVSEDRTLRTR
jgi:hypothetical protein